MKKELLSVLSLGLLISLAPGCCNRCETSNKKKNETVKKRNPWNAKTLDDIAYNDEDEEKSALAQVDTDNDDEDVVTQF
jgi:hypothetical protein